MKRTIFLSPALLILFLVTSLFSADPSYLSEIQKWQKERVTNLQKDDGWPTLVGLYWLDEGANTIGSGKDQKVLLPAPAPQKLGILRLEKGVVRFEPEQGANVQVGGKQVMAPLELSTDRDPKVEPTRLSVESITFFLIQRADRIGVRVRDKNSPTRKNISKLEYFPINPEWRVTATLDPYNPPKKIPIVNVLGMVEPVDSTGAVVFNLNGKQHRLDALEEEGDNGERIFWLIFADSTNGKFTYGAGRYLYTSSLGKDNKVIVDFNKAYSPPCAFTSFATCPLPPKQNKLPLPVEAGEKYTPEIHR